MLWERGFWIRLDKGKLVKERCGKDQKYFQTKVRSQGFTTAATPQAHAQRTTPLSPSHGRA